MQNGQSTFSSLDCVRNLKSAGFTQEQAEAQAKEFERSRSDLISHLATKNDIEKIKSEIESSLTFRMAVLAGIVVSVIGVQMAVFKFFF